MSTDREGRRNSAKDDEGGSNLEQLIKFLKGKIDDDDIAQVIHMLNGGDPQDMGQDVGRKIGADNMSALRARIGDARSSNYAKFEEHRKGLGLRRIRVLG
jgi:hypothetical protein